MNKTISVILIECLLCSCILAGCGRDIPTADRQVPVAPVCVPEETESATEAFYAEDEETDLSEQQTETVDSQAAAPRLRDIRNEVSEFQHSSAWDKYEEPDNFPFSHDFIQSSNQFVNNWIKYSLFDMLYSYEQQVHQNLLSENWTIERITLIGGDYYHVQLLQEVSEVQIGCLICPSKDRYLILYAICEDGNRTTTPDSNVHYFSQAEWHGYTPEYSAKDADMMEEKLYNPFAEAFLTSTHTTLCAILCYYLRNDTRIWEVADIYECALTNYYLVSDDRVAWICVDMSNREYTMETFYAILPQENSEASDESNSVDIPLSERYSDVPKELLPVLEQYFVVQQEYERIIRRDVYINHQEIMERVVAEQGFDYVYVEIGVLERDKVGYSLYDLTGDGFPELIIGSYNGEDAYPYCIYYYSPKDGVRMDMESTPWYVVTIHEDGIVEIHGHTAVEPIYYYQFQQETDALELAVGLECKVDSVYDKNYGSEIDKVVGYCKFVWDKETHDRIYEDISEEAYQRIREKYSAPSAELEWRSM